MRTSGIEQNNRGLDSRDDSTFAVAQGCSDLPRDLGNPKDEAGRHLRRSLFRMDSLPMKNAHAGNHFINYQSLIGDWNATLFLDSTYSTNGMPAVKSLVKNLPA
jgi:hypothetical protein